MDDLWFDLAVRGEPNLKKELVGRLHLSDGADPPKAERPDVQPAPEDPAAITQPPEVDVC